jgi:PAS domain S-box-containing protein
MHPLFAEVELVGVMISGVFAGVVLLVSTVLTLRYQNKAEEARRREKVGRRRRAEALREKATHKAEKEAQEEKVTAVYRRNVDVLRERLMAIEQQYRETSKSEADCRVKVANLEGKINFLEYSVRRLQVIARDESPITTAEGLIFTDAGHRIVRLNDAALALFEYGEEGYLVGQPVDVLFHDAHLDAYRQAATRVLGVGGWATLPMRGYTKAGVEIEVSVTLSAFRDSDAPSGIVVCAAVNRHYRPEQVVMDRETGSAEIQSIAAAAPIQGEPCPDVPGVAG